MADRFVPYALKWILAREQALAEAEPHAERIEEEIDGFQRQLSEQGHELDGTLRIREQWIGFHRDPRRLPRLRTLVDSIVAQCAGGCAAAEKSYANRE